jgi:DNA-binding response OmpR family regulator
MVEISRRSPKLLAKELSTMVDHSPIKTTILLLVSDPVARSVLEETLANEGYTVLPAGDLGNAVDWIKRCAPDLLITRNHVEGLPGHDAAMYLREKYLKMSVLILGGLLDDERLLNREALQGFAIFPKPYTKRELLQEVKWVLSVGSEQS